MQFFIFHSIFMAIREYFILWALGVLCVFSLAIGVERMMKIILSNYILSMMALTLSSALGAFLWWLNIQAPDIASTIAPAFANKTIIVLVVYLLLLLLLFLKSRISIHFHVGWVQKMLLTILCIPMTITSIAITLQIAVLWLQTFDFAALQLLVNPLQIQDYYKVFILNTPIVICIHAIVTVLILSHINWTPKLPSFSLKKSSPQMWVDSSFDE